MYIYNTYILYIILETGILEYMLKIPLSLSQQY